MTTLTVDEHTEFDDPASGKVLHLRRCGDRVTVKTKNGRVLFGLEYETTEQAAAAYANRAVGHDENLAPAAGDVIHVRQEGVITVATVTAGTSQTGWTVQASEGRESPLRLWDNFRWISRVVS